ncbi:glycosyltransferase family 4 protein [Rubellicoccus peritrichatus]|uniref:Glycosyltransferase family 4 protein n=1 Tax=Rubellicoccus peritrichatus TaxID=3080537 RepID=A0AAQ3QPT9_9BACT|nr:glycosyltransferase family 4 protein [Puniceicoccus sp. CR14]WOO39458.1 glycosyltransferase family 4 protein [Puniceicoccus sp. CR14]
MSSQLVILTHEFYPKRGGIAVYTEETARAACDLGWETTVWAPEHEALTNKDFPFAVRKVGIKGNLGWGDRKTMMWQIMQEARPFESSTVILTEPGPILAAMYLNAMGKLPFGKFSVVLHGSEILRFCRLRYRRELFGALLNHADKIGVVSRFTKKLLLRYYPFLGPKTVIVSGGLRTDFQPTSPAKPEKDTCTVLSLGRIHPRKGLHCLIEAVDHLPADVKSKICLSFVGPITDKNYLEKLKQMAKTSACRIEFPGPIEDERLPEAYAAADIFTLTSLRAGPSVEGFGMVCIEAGATGLPVIANRSGGIPEAVRHGKTGLIVSPRDRRDLAKAIQSLVEDQELRQRLGKAGVARAAELSWASNAEALVGKP